MNFQQLRHFVVTAASGNIFKAAQELNITQSGLSRSISALEDSLRMPLFERGPKGVTLTEVGRQFLPYAQHMLHEQARILDHFTAHREMRAGSVAIGINHSFAYYIIPQAIASVLRQWPKLQISIMTDGYQGLVKRMLNGELDFAMSLYTPSNAHPALRYDDLFSIQTRVFARAGHELTALEQVDAKALADCNWALVNGASAEAAFSHFFRSRNITPPTVSLRCASVALLVEVIQDTDLVTILPEELIATDAGLQLAQLSTEAPFGTARCGLFYRKGSVELPSARHFADAIRTEAQLLAKLPG